MNILEMTTFLRGGAGVFVTRLSQALNRRGHQVYVISSGTVEELTDWKELLCDLQQNTIMHETFNFFKRENPIFWTEAARISHFLIEKSIDVIHAHAGIPALGAHIARTMAGLDIPIVATFHSWSRDRPEWMNIQDTWAFNQCYEVYFDSEEYRRLGLTHGLKAENSVIYPGLLIDPTDYVSRQEELRQSLRERYKLNPEAKVITNLAEITDRKGQLDLVRSLKEIVKVEPNTYVVLIGECQNAKYKAEIEEAIEQGSLQNHVLFPGWVRDPYELVAGSDLFVFPSYSEGLGMAIIEAISLGIPAIFSYEEGMKDIADQLGNNGFGTFCPGDIQHMGLLITRQLSIPREDLKTKVQAASKEMRSCHAFIKTVDQYEHAMIMATRHMKH